MTPAETKRLKKSLEAVRRILGHAGIYGGREVTTAYDFERRITRLLEPEDASALCAEADAFTAINLPFIDKNRARVQQAESDQKAEEAHRKAVTDAHHAKQRAAADARREREQRAIAVSAINEIL
jgi:hypothetical protein